MTRKDNVDNTVIIMEKEKKNKRSKIGLENVNYINKKRDSIVT